jgi:hypothetical protein
MVGQDHDGVADHRGRLHRAGKGRAQGVDPVSQQRGATLFQRDGEEEGKRCPDHTVTA